MQGKDLGNQNTFTLNSGPDAICNSASNKRNHGHWCSDAHIPIVIAKKSKDVCVVINYFDVESWNVAVNNRMLFRIMSASSCEDP